MECSHKNFSIKKVEKEIFNLKFTHKTQVCSDCGAFLRGKDFEKSYLLWLEKIYKKRRDKFQVQCHFSKNLLRCIDEFLQEYPGVSSTVLMRILSTIYIDYIDPNQRLLNQFNELLDKEIFDSFVKEKNIKKVNIQFKPKMMIDLVAISVMIEMSPSQIVESSIQKMMTAITSRNEKLRVFWKKEIEGYLETMLKAV